MNNESFLIEENDLEIAKNICNEIEDSTTRNRAVANALASDIAKKYFTDLEVDTESGLHKIAFVLKELDLADIYVNGTYIDVRLYFEENELCVPKSHFENNLLPAAYMFIKIDSDLTEGNVTGFITPDAVDCSIESNGYYRVAEEQLVSYYDIEHLFGSMPNSEPSENFESNIFEYLDGRMDETGEFYRTLLSSKYCREALKKAANVHTIFKYVSIANNSENDGISSSINTQNLDNPALEEFETLNNQDLSLELDSGILEETEALNIIDEHLENTELQIQDESDYMLEDTDLQENIDNEQLILDESEIFDTTIEDSSNLEITSLEENTDILEDFDTEQNTDTNNIQENEFNDITEIISNEIPIETYDDSSELEQEPLEEISEFSTNVTPSIDTIEEILTENDFEEIDTNNNESLYEEENIEKDIIVENNEHISDNENFNQIEELFGEENHEDSDTIEGEISQTKKRKNSKILPLLSTLIIVSGIGYFGYTKFINTAQVPEEFNNKPVESKTNTGSVINNEQKEEAMPLETVENTPVSEIMNEGNAISIPAIEQNLDASILVSNLTINWEVPAGYVTNNTAKRYFTKIGKIIQLNLKTELLLLSKPPITNKIMLELEFNKNNNKFVIKGVTASSGEKTVDDLIVKTVKNVLDMNLKINTNTFTSISGNPVLVIHL